ncbi:MAG: CvpA family protein [Planctomycetaceae bacterium]|jgi:uncharacterized membrane protein required for colicin V production|nr:CvpA family protein [Planctomycetaceae bacterium]
MSVFDLIIFAILITLAFRGWMTGMVAQIVSVGSLAVSWIVASRFAFLIAPSIPAEKPWNNIGAIIVLFIITFFAVRLAHQYLEKKIKDWNLAKWNRYFGGLLGFLKGLILCMVLTFFGVMLSETTRDIVFQSKSGNMLARLIEKTETFIPSDSCELLHLQFERFNAKIDNDKKQGTNNLNATENSSDLSPEEKSLQKMREFLPSGQEVQSFQAKTQSNLNELISQGNSFLEQTKNFQQGTEKAASLLDAIGKWWTGSESKKENNETKTTETEQTQHPEVDADSVTNATILPSASLLSESLLSKSIAELPEQPVRAANPQNVANSSAETTAKPFVPLATLSASTPTSSAISEEKTLFRRRFSQHHSPTTQSLEPLTLSASSISLTSAMLPTTSATATTTLPELSGFALPADESSDVMATPIPISRSSVPFRLRSSEVYSSERLLHSSPTHVPATLFTSKKQ